MGLCHQSKTTYFKDGIGHSGKQLMLCPQRSEGQVDQRERSMCVFLFTTKMQRNLGRPGSAQVALLGGRGTQAEAALKVPLALGSKGKSPGWAWTTDLQP